MRSPTASTRRLLLIAALLAAGACDEGTPVSPADAVIRLSAYPTRIARTGTSNLTIQVLRGNGNPVNPGTEVRLSSTIGQVDPVVFTDDDGVAHGALTGDGRVGTATVTAYSGAVEPVTTEVEVGSLVAAITLTADPTSLPETGGEVSLLALVRDDSGQPLPGATVNFRTEAGTLDSGGRFITTDANGEATDTLTVSAADAQAEPDDRITVTVEAGGEGGIVEDSVDILIQGPPIASFSFTLTGTIGSFTDTSSGDPTSWFWDFGHGGQTSTEQNPVHTFPNDACFTVRLRVTNAFGSSEASRLVVVGTPPGGC